MNSLKNFVSMIRHLSLSIFRVFFETYISLKVIDKNRKVLNVNILRSRAMDFESSGSYIRAHSILNYIRNKHQPLTRSDLKLLHRINARLKLKSYKLGSAKGDTSNDKFFIERELVKDNYSSFQRMISNIVDLTPVNYYWRAINWILERDSKPGVVEKHKGNRFCLEFTRATFYSQSNWITTQSFAYHNFVSNNEMGDLVDAESDSPCFALFEDGHAFFDLEGFSFLQFESVIWLGGWGASEFGHFMQSILPKLLEMNSIPELDEIPLVMDESIPQNHRKIIEKLSHRRVIYIDAKSAVTCETLFYVTDWSFCPVQIKNFKRKRPACPVEPHSLSTLKKYFPPTNSPRSNLIYISRSSSSWRKLTNERELEILLKSKGFRIVDFYNISIEEVAQVLDSAKIVVAPLGSSLLNLGFCRKGTKVLVLVGNIYNEEYLAGAFDVMGLDCFFLQGSSENSHRHSNYNINAEEFLKAISLLQSMESHT